MLIFLVGYMGSGKSSFGKKLSLKLQIDFIDLDNYIEEKCQMSIQELFDKKGEAHFRILEDEALKILAKKDNLVIATGGGAACSFENMELMNKHGITVYLQSSADLLLNRLKKSKKERPLIKDKNEEELKIFIEQSLEKREVFYLKSKYIIDAKNANVDHLVFALQHK